MAATTGASARTAAEPGVAPTTLILAALVVTGLSIRGPVVGMPLLLPYIGSELGVRDSALGLLPALPLLCFAIVSPLAAIFASRWGSEVTLLCGMVVLAIALLVRPWYGFGLLLAGSVLVGVGIAAANVLVPSIVRRRFGARASLFAGITTASYGVGSVIWAWSAGPTAGVVGWRVAMAILAAPVIVAIGLLALDRWRVGIHPARRDSLGAGETVAVPATAEVKGRFRPWKRSGSWWLALFFGFQSVLFFGTSTWLPAELRATAGDGADAGIALALFQGLGVLGMLSVPLLTRRVRPYRSLGYTAVAGFLALFLGLLAASQLWWLWVGIGGYAQGLGVSIALVLVAVRPELPAMVPGISALMQTFGYAMAALAPVVFAGIAEATGSWVSVLWFSVALTVALGLVTHWSCRSTTIRA